ncbi:MAG TPA: hypothetical protein VNP93_08195 [Gaiellaceae bacterium]|nr:hypothetical protein [Gaiellaceae bacterium]
MDDGKRVQKFVLLNGDGVRRFPAARLTREPVEAGPTTEGGPTIETTTNTTFTKKKACDS